VLYLNAGDNILVPKPGFPLYQVITQSLGGSVKQYPLIPEKSWNCDIEAMDSLIDSRTKVIVISNPSNPCGSNFTAEHLREICAVARKHNLPILADEIYAGLVFTGEFAPLHVHSGDVPVISVGGAHTTTFAVVRSHLAECCTMYVFTLGIAKEFVVPGWRVGWLVMHDKGTGRLADLAVGIRNLTQLILGMSAVHSMMLLPRLVVRHVLNWMLSLYLRRCELAYPGHSAAHSVPGAGQR
jgi:tyrosine aminotransferase